MAWFETALTRALGVRRPIVQAPMAGGWTTPELVARVGEAGGLGSVAGAMSDADDLRRQIRAVRALTARPFAVNLFAPLPPPADRGLDDWALLLGVTVPSPRPAPLWEDQLQVVVDERVPVLSFTFGIPSLHDLPMFTIGTATTVAEALALEAAGVHAVVAQGFEAGGHRGTFLGPAEQSLVGTMALVPQVVDAVNVPVIAAGGIMDGRGIAAARLLGAQGVQLGTAFLATTEAAISPAQRQALTGGTSITRVLTGRAARAVRTPLVERLEASGAQPPDYPLPRLFLDEAPLLAGQGNAMARALPAAELVALLGAETDRALSAL